MDPDNRRAQFEHPQLTDEHIALAVRVAKRVCWQRRKPHLLDEFIDEACVLLVDVSGKFNPSKGPFEPFARTRIMFGLFDWDDIQSGRTRLQTKGAKAARAEERILGEQEQHTPTADEIIEAMAVPEPDVAKVLASAHGLRSQFVSEENLQAAVAQVAGQPVHRVKRVLDLFKEMVREQNRNGNPKEVTATDVARRLKTHAEAYQKNRRQEIPIDDEEPTTAFSPHELAQGATQETELRVKEALSKIPEAYRMSLLLVKGQGLSYEEAAAKLGLPVGTVKSQVSRAREMFAEIYNGQKGVK